MTSWQISESSSGTDKEICLIILHKLKTFLETVHISFRIFHNVEENLYQRIFIQMMNKYWAFTNIIHIYSNETWIPQVCNTPSVSLQNDCLEHDYYGNPSFLISQIKNSFVTIFSILEMNTANPDNNKVIRKSVTIN